MISSISNQTPVKELIRLRGREYIDLISSDDSLSTLHPKECWSSVMYYIYFGQLNEDVALTVDDMSNVSESFQEAPLFDTLVMMQKVFPLTSSMSATIVDEAVDGKMYWAIVTIPTEGISLSYVNGTGVHGRYNELNYRPNVLEKECPALYSKETGLVMFGSADNPAAGGVMSSLTEDEVISCVLVTVE